MEIVGLSEEVRDNADSFMLCSAHASTSQKKRTMPKIIQQPIAQFKQHLFFSFLIKYGKIRHFYLIREVRRFAESFEKLSPALQARNRHHCLYRTENGRLTAQDIPFDSGDVFVPKIARFFEKNEIQELILDCRLEKNQIIESLAVFISAAGRLKTTVKKEPALYITNSEHLAQALVGSGLQRFCARTCFDQVARRLEITYSYCELFYTYSLKQLLKKIGRPLNHRSMFTFAPWAGVVAFLLLFFHIWFWGNGSISELSAGLFASIVLGLTVFYLFQTLASTVYDREHQELLLQERMQEVTGLSQFPQHNPNPILKTDKNGRVLFHNPAVKALLGKMDGNASSASDLLPDDAKERIKKCLESNSTFEFDFERHGRELRYTVTPFSNEDAVFWGITDITRLKKLEDALRELNQSLEEKVLQRTQELVATQDVTILSLSSLAETRDPDTGAHLNRTRLYVKTLADHLRSNSRFSPELDDEVIDLLYRSAPLHDIGKVGIPDSILLKPGSLTEEEFELMKEHPKIGGDSLKLAEKDLGENAFLRNAWEIAYYHHEKWDGSGYPFGLKGDSIPISARLMALADVYDALINKRVYKEAFSHEKSKDIILKGKGAHFDPDVVDAFLDKEEEFIAIANEYAE